MPWLTHAGEPRPWRADPRLTPFFEPGYPDDVMVLFLNPDSATGGKNEGMWVTVIAYDKSTDEYLGILLNQPDFLKSVVQGDNVVLHPMDGHEPPHAVAERGDYSVPGWPANASPFLATLREGIRAYRAGQNGHNMPGIERCIEVLSPAMRAVRSDASADELFVAHFVLGRCLAEKYETGRAIEQFRAAIALDSMDLDAHMALLAELSVMSHSVHMTALHDEVDKRDGAFLAELALVRARFGRDPGVDQILQLVFDPSQEDAVTPAWRDELLRLRRIGYAVFRWKQR